MEYQSQRAGQGQSARENGGTIDGKLISRRQEAQVRQDIGYP